MPLVRYLWFLPHEMEGQKLEPNHSPPDNAEVKRELERLPQFLYTPSWQQ
jgi:hypothetical protein